MLELVIPIADVGEIPQYPEPATRHRSSIVDGPRYAEKDLTPLRRCVICDTKNAGIGRCCSLSIRQHNDSLKTERCDIECSACICVIRTNVSPKPVWVDHCAGIDGLRCWEWIRALG